MKISAKCEHLEVKG